MSTGAAEVLRDLRYSHTMACDPRVFCVASFEDSTQNTRCLAGPASRAGADATGNPIGKVSAEMASDKPSEATSAMTP